MLVKHLKAVIVVAALVATATPAHADWSTGNPILDAIRAVISINNAEKKLKNLDIKKESQDIVIGSIENAGKNYGTRSVEENWESYKNSKK